MLTPIEWKQIAGYPEAAYCPTHDRLIEPIIVRNDTGVATWGCAYCAEEVMPAIEATCKVPQIEETHLPMHYHSSQLTYWCPEKQCHFHTVSKMAMDTHRQFMHSESETIKCTEGLCTNSAFEFCVQCESAMCKDHLDWKDMCPSCGVDRMWPGY